MADGRLVIGTQRYSSWSLRGWLSVRLAGLNVDIDVIPLAGGGKTTALKTLSPNGCVPYLEHHGAVVWDSLLPSQVRKWASCASSIRGWESLILMTGKD